MALQFAALALKATSLIEGLSQALAVGQMLVQAGKDAAPAAAALGKLLGGQTLSDEERMNLNAIRKANSAAIAQPLEPPPET